MVVRDWRPCALYICWVAPVAVLEECEGVRVGPFSLAPGEAGADDASAPWATPQDFDWPRSGPSPHWRVLEVGERVEAPSGGGLEEAARLPPGEG